MLCSDEAVLSGNPPLRILQVITDTDRRGAQVFATDLEPALFAQGLHVTTVALAPGTTSPALEVPVLGPTRRSPATMVALRRAARTADVVVAHGSTTLPACALALPGTGVPFVYRQISESLFWAPTPSRRRRVRAFLGRAARVVALSAAQREVLVEHFGVPRERLAVVPNGVPAAGFPAVGAAGREAARVGLGIDADAAVVLSISALVPEKGVDLVIDALGDDGGRAGVPGPVVLLVAGDGPVRGDLERRAAAHPGLDVRFLGALDDPRPVYAAADVVVLASRGGDSMPATLVEAAYTGLPVVATPVGSIGEIVVDGVTGTLVPVGDADALRRALAVVLADPAAAAAMGEQARAHALARFEIATVAAAWAGVLRAAAERQGRGRSRLRTAGTPA